MQAPFILDRNFRTSPVFCINEWRQLSSSERHLLDELSGSEDVYGVFTPTIVAPHLTAKLAYTDTALLYFHLQKAQRLPYFFINHREDSINKTLAQLVLDSVLEIEWRNEFVSGSSAVEAIYGPAAFSAPTKPSALALLSLQAVSNAFLLRKQEVKALAQWLYTCNTWPMDATTKRHVSAGQPLYEFLFSKSDSNTQHMLEQSWRFVAPHQHFSWYSWLKPEKRVTRDKPTYKLYISPAPAQMPDVFAKSIPLLTASRAFCIKAGATMQGLLRPDKLIVYFAERAALFDTALVLEKELSAFRPHGVPFTGQLDQHGMLSWGIDPPTADVLQAVEDGSWRTMVTEQLALAILEAKEEKLRFESAFPFLQAKMLAVGVRINDWTAVEDQE